MIALLEGQPEEFHAPILNALSASAVQASVCLFMDFATTPLRICNRTIPFEDLQGNQWEKGAHLIVGLPDLSRTPEEQMPLREYTLALPIELLTQATWQRDLTAMVLDRSEYNGRKMELSMQLFEPATGAPLGYPFVLDAGWMDAQSLSFSIELAEITQSVESNLVRQGAPVAGVQTDLDQQHRFNGDLGFSDIRGRGQVLNWPNWS